jgi:hypothetical protein
MAGTPSARRARLDQTRAKLGEVLFPAPPPSTRQVPRWETAALLTAILTLGVVVALLRLGWSASLNTVWAEDGPVYLQEALTKGFWDAIFTPYAGYLVLVPRLIAEAATLVPLEQAAAAISIISALFAVLSGLAVWHGCGGHVRNPYLRGGLALATVLAASAGQETLLSAAYVPWYMLVGSFWLLFWRPQTVWGASLGGLFMLATGMSTPGVWFFMPVALLRAATARDSRDAILVGSFMLGAAIQVPVILGQEQGESLWTSHIWTAYLQRVVDGGLLGQRLGGNLWEELGWAFLAPLVAAAVAGFAWGIWRSTPGPRWFAVIAILSSLVIFVLSVYQRSVGLNVFWSEGSSGGTSSRYVLVPALLLISAAVVLVDGALRRRTRTGFAWPVVAALAVIGLAIVTSYDMRGGGFREAPYWDDALQQAAAKCQATGDELAGIPTSPAPFGVQVPCEEIESFANATQTNPARLANASRAASGE